MNEMRMGLYLVLGVAIVIGAIMGLRTAREQAVVPPLQPWHSILLFLWLLGGLAAYPSFATQHTTLPYLRYSLIMMTITYVAAFLSSIFWYPVFLLGRKAAAARSRRNAVY